jgi:Ca2+-binding EF-hand superfamily protein
MSCLVKFGTLLALGAATAAGAQTPLAAGDLPRAQFIAQMDAQFRLRDADGDGRITRAELTQFEQRTAHAAALAENARAFARLDANHDGALSANEFAALVPPAAAPDVTPLMQRFDPNRDQAITLIEYRAATLANFDAIDTDHDGVVTQAEMRAGNVPTGAGR